MWGWNQGSLLWGIFYCKCSYFPTVDQDQEFVCFYSGSLKILAMKYSLFQTGKLRAKLASSGWLRGACASALCQESPDPACRRAGWGQYCLHVCLEPSWAWLLRCPSFRVRPRPVRIQPPGLDTLHMAHILQPFAPSVADLQCPCSGFSDSPILPQGTQLVLKQPHFLFLAPWSATAATFLRATWLLGPTPLVTDIALRSPQPQRISNQVRGKDVDEKGTTPFQEPESHSFLGEMVNYFLKMKKSFVVICIQAVPALEEDTERLRSLYTQHSVFAHGGGRREDFPCSCPAVHGLTILQALASVLSSY